MERFGDADAPRAILSVDADGRASVLGKIGYHGRFGQQLSGRL